MRKMFKKTAFVLALVIGTLLASQMVSMGVSEGPAEPAPPAPKPEEPIFCAIIISN